MSTRRANWKASDFEDELYDDDYYDDDYDDEEEYGSRSYQAAKPKAPIPTPKKTPSKKASPAPSPAKAPGHKHDASTGKKGGGAASSTPLPGLAAMSRGSSAVSTASAGSAGALSAVSASEDAVTPLPITDRTPPVGEKPCLSLIIAGHVDVGKSTLMGHFLVQAGVVENRVVRKFEKESKDIGKASFAFAWVLDQNESERSRGVTMDVSLQHFTTASYRCVLLDAPGHKDFVPRMIAGATAADVAILVVSAIPKEFEAGFGDPVPIASGDPFGAETSSDRAAYSDSGAAGGGQTKENAILLRSLGVRNIIVAVNKMDQVAWSQTRFLELQSTLQTFLETVGYASSSARFVPVSGLLGENLTSAPSAPEASWYAGPSLLQMIDTFPAPVRLLSAPLRVSLSDVFGSGGSAGCMVAGRIESGTLGVGDKLIVQPGGVSASVKKVNREDVSVPVAFAGDYILATLGGITSEHLHIGDVLSGKECPGSVHAKLEADIQTLPTMFDTALFKGQMLEFHFQSVAIPCVLSKIRFTIGKSGEPAQKKPKFLSGVTRASVVIKLSRSLPLETSSDHPKLSKFVLRYCGQSLAAGSVSRFITTKTKRL